MNKILIIISIGVACIHLNLILCDPTQNRNSLLNRIKRAPAVASLALASGMYDSDNSGGYTEVASRPTYGGISDEYFIKLCNDGTVTVDDTLTPHQFELYVKCKVKKPFIKVSDFVKKHNHHHDQGTTTPSSKI